MHNLQKDKMTPSSHLLVRLGAQVSFFETIKNTPQDSNEIYGIYLKVI